MPAAREDQQIMCFALSTSYFLSIEHNNRDSNDLSWETMPSLPVKIVDFGVRIRVCQSVQRAECERVWPNISIDLGFHGVNCVRILPLDQDEIFS